jgi:hypothetical protein
MYKIYLLEGNGNRSCGWLAHVGALQLFLWLLLCKCTELFGLCFENRKKFFPPLLSVLFICPFLQKMQQCKDIIFYGSRKNWPMQALHLQRMNRIKSPDQNSPGFPFIITPDSTI